MGAVMLAIDQILARTEPFQAPVLARSLGQSLPAYAVPLFLRLRREQ